MPPENKNSRPLMAAVASQQQVIEAQAKEISSLRKGLEMIAHYAGLSKKLASIVTADVNNPASPVPDPPSEPPTETTEEAVAAHAHDDPRNLGIVPGANDGVAADATTTALSPGADVNTPPFNELVDVTKPVSGTETQIPLDQTRIETDVRVGDPDDPNPAFPLNDAFKGEANTGANSPDLRAKSSRTRTLAALKLAKLRVAAGIDEGDELEVAGRIEAEAAYTDERIENEIETLAAVQKAASVRGGRSQPLRTTKTQGVQRTVPSLSGQPEMNRTASAVPITQETEDSDLFLDF